VIEHVAEMYENVDPDRIARHLENADQTLADLVAWMRKDFQCDLDVEELGELDQAQLQRKLVAAVEDRYRPEMRMMERRVLLDVVDDAWKSHLAAMDRLKSSVGLVGYAQLDAKVEYKREGMRTFEQMWDNIGEQVTDLVFRMERVDEGFVRSTFVEGSATHAAAPTLSDEQRQAMRDIVASGKGDEKLEPIRIRGTRAGRNDPCPCGSGKKYKNCCMRSGNVVNG